MAAPALPVDKTSSASQDQTAAISPDMATPDSQDMEALTGSTTPTSSVDDSSAVPPDKTSASIDETAALLLAMVNPHLSDVHALRDSTSPGSATSALDQKAAISSDIATPDSPGMEELRGSTTPTSSGGDTSTLLADTTSAASIDETAALLLAMVNPHLPNIHALRDSTTPTSSGSETSALDQTAAISDIATPDSPDMGALRGSTTPTSSGSATSALDQTAAISDMATPDSPDMGALRGSTTPTSSGSATSALEQTAAISDMATPDSPDMGALRGSTTLTSSACGNSALPADTTSASINETTALLLAMVNPHIPDIQAFRNSATPTSSGSDTSALPGDKTFSAFQDQTAAISGDMAIPDSQDMEELRGSSTPTSSACDTSALSAEVTSSVSPDLKDSSSTSCALSAEKMSSASLDQHAALVSDTTKPIPGEITAYIISDTEISEPADTQTSTSKDKVPARKDIALSGSPYQETSALLNVMSPEQPNKVVCKQPDEVVAPPDQANSAIACTVSPDQGLVSSGNKFLASPSQATNILPDIATNTPLDGTLPALTGQVCPTKEDSATVIRLKTTCALPASSMHPSKTDSTTVCETPAKCFESTCFTTEKVAQDTAMSDSPIQTNPEQPEKVATLDKVSPAQTDPETVIQRDKEVSILQLRISPAPMDGPTSPSQNKATTETVNSIQSAPDDITTSVAVHNTSSVNKSCKSTVSDEVAVTTCTSSDLTTPASTTRSSSELPEKVIGARPESISISQNKPSQGASRERTSLNALPILSKKTSVERTFSTTLKGGSLKGPGTGSCFSTVGNSTTLPKEKHFLSQPPKAETQEQSSLASLKMSDYVTSGLLSKDASQFSPLLFNESLSQSSKSSGRSRPPFIDLVGSINSPDVRIGTHQYKNQRTGSNSSVSSSGGASRFQDITAVHGQISEDGSSSTLSQPVYSADTFTSSVFGTSLEKRSASSSPVEYTVPSAAERAEEMLAMQRECRLDVTSVVENSSLRGVPKERRSLPSIAKSICSSNPPVAIKSEVPDVIEDTVDTFTSTTHNPAPRADHVNSKYASMHAGPTKPGINGTIGDSGLGSGPMGEKAATDFITGVSTDSRQGLTSTKLCMDDNMPISKSQGSTLRQQQLDCLKNAHGIMTYTPPVIPVKFRQFFTNTYACSGCDDIFLFESSLETHINRKSMCIVCKHKNCLGQNPEKLYTNRCAYISHLKTHGMSLKDDIQFTISGPTDEMLDSFVDMVKLPNSRPCLPGGMPLSTQWKCIECKLVLESAQDLANHFIPKSETGRNILNCGMCNMNFQTSCSFISHRRTHTRQKPYVCPECGQLFLGTWEVFEKHLRQKCFHIFRTRTYKCSCCSLLYSSIVEMVQHVVSHKETYHKCLNCPMAFKTGASIKAHMMSAHAVDGTNSTFIFKCAVCDTVFHSIDQLEGHTRNHVNEFNKLPKSCFKCWLCKQFFCTVQDLENHLTTSHKVQRPRILCDMCGEDCKTLGELCKHLETHQDTDVLNCMGHVKGVERMAFVRQSSEEMVASSKKTKTIKRKQVKVQAATPKMFRCSVCEFTCTKEDLAGVHAHIQEHRREGILLCPNCFTAKFEDWTDLRRHQFLCRKRKSALRGSTTSKNDSHVCCKCGVTTSSEQDLEKHMQSEHDIAPQYPCHLCGLTYETRRGLKRHVLTTHEGKKQLFLCWICQSKNIKKTFSIAPKLKKHLITKHRVPRNTIDPETFPRLIPGINDKDTVLPGPSKRAANEDTNQAPIKRLKVVGDAVFYCAKCEFSSEDKEAFNNHIKQHKAETDSKQCPECGLCFSVLPSLKKHLIMVHKIEDIDKYIGSSSINEEKGLGYFSVSPAAPASQSDPQVEEDSGNPLECRVCYRTFDSVALLRTHMRTHGMAFIRSKRSLVSPS